MVAGDQAPFNPHFPFISPLPMTLFERHARFKPKSSVSFRPLLPTPCGTRPVFCVRYGGFTRVSGGSLGYSLATVLLPFAYSRSGEAPARRQ